MSASSASGEYAPMEQTSAAALASKIQELSPPPPPTAAAAAPSGPEAVAPVPAPASDYTWLYVIVGTLIVASSRSSMLLP